LTVLVFSHKAWMLGLLSVFEFSKER